MSAAAQRTAFVFAGGGSLGAVQVGMLRELMHAGVSADLVVGFSVGAMNAAYFAGAPNAAGVRQTGKSLARTVDDGGGRVAGFGTGVLREGDKWECMQILGELDRTNSLYFDRVSQIKMEGSSRVASLW